MLVYKVSYIGMDDNRYSEFFSSKSEADKRFKRLNREVKRHEKHLENEDADEDNSSAECKMVFDPTQIRFDLSRKGILEMLNRYFYEQ